VRAPDAPGDIDQRARFERTDARLEDQQTRGNNNLKAVATNEMRERLTDVFSGSRKPDWSASLANWITKTEGDFSHDD
jgi:hypothetical protein